MPAHGPRYRQRTRSTDGTLWKYSTLEEFPGGIYHNVPQIVRVNAPVYSSKFCAACPLRTNEIIVNQTGLGVEHSYIRDYVNSRDSDGDLSVARVDHDKIDTLGISNIVPWKHDCCGGFGNQVVTPNGVYKPFITNTVFERFAESPPDSVLAPLCDEAFNRFNIQFPTEVSVANFILELDDIVGLIPKLSKSLVRSAANAHLTLEFGWKPMISDVRAMYHTLDRVKARLAYLRKTFGKKTDLGFRRNDIYVPSLAPVGTSMTATVGNGIQFRYVLVDYHCDFRAKGRLYHRMEYLDGAAGEIAGLLGALGFSNPLAIVWEAIPYSFVVDWFTNIGDLVTRYGVLQDLGSQWTVDRLCWSVTIKATVDVYQRNVTGSGALITETRLGQVTFKRYKRRPGLSVSSSVLNLSLPNFRQSALLASLFLGKRPG